MSEGSISTSTPISELITHIKYSFRERDFNDVQQILMDREHAMKMEIEDLTRDRDTAKNEVVLLERALDLKELERLKLDDKLVKSQRKCEELEETVTRLLEEKKLSDDREERAEERCHKIAAENLKLASEKMESIFELNKKINGLKNKNLEIEGLVGVYEEKCRCLDVEIVKMGQEIEDFRGKQLSGDRVVEELKGEIAEANKTIEELRVKKSESDKAAELYKSRFDNLSARIVKTEENLADMLALKVGDLAGLVNEVRDLATSENGKILNFKESRGKNCASRNHTTPDADADDVVILSPDVRSSSGSSKKGDRNLVQSRTVKTSPCLQSGRSPQAEISRRKEPLASGRFNKTACSSSAVGGEIIQVIDIDDDDENPPQAPGISKGGTYRNEINSGKRKPRTDIMGDLHANSATKRKKNTCMGDEDVVLVDERENGVVSRSSHGIIDCSSSRRCEEEIGPACDSGFPLEKLNGLSDEVSTDSDGSCTDSRMEELVASLRSGKKFVYEADMLRTFQQDEELCMNAVCALYRQQVAAKKPKGRSNLSDNRGFSPVDSISGCALAEYLIDGDKELKLRKSVSEVRKQRPDAITQCRKLANIYVEKLFAIYCTGEDPLFCQ
ncbi:hypothetical protein OROGR_014740 [Orobanche gracilis]